MFKTMYLGYMTNIDDDNTKKKAFTFNLFFCIYQFFSSDMFSNNVIIGVYKSIPLQFYIDNIYAKCRHDYANLIINYSHTVRILFIKPTNQPFSYVRCEIRSTTYNG